MIRTVIIEDEENSLTYLKSILAKHCPEIVLIGTASTVEESTALLIESRPDLVFMDVELNGVLSFNIFRHLTLPVNFEVIFTTAYDKYAFQAIKHACLEYLLKPIDYRELVKAIEIYNKRKKVSINQKQIELLIQNASISADKIEKIAIPSQDGFVLVKIADIIYCESDANYTRIYSIQGEKILSSRNLSAFMEKLPHETFFRCHKSSLINMNYIKKYAKSDGYKVLMEGGYWIDISQRKKDEFVERIGKM